MAIPSTTGPMVVEFWASWCGPCRAAFPHLSELARAHRGRGLTVVGINIEGDSPAVRRMVEQQGPKMDYTVAVDAGQQAANALMGAARVSGIPVAFILDRAGAVRHYGHPMEPKFAQVLAQVCAEQPVPQAPPPAPRRPAPVTRGREELLAAPVRELKAILDDWGVGYGDLNEKAELVDRVLERCRGGAGGG